MNGTIAVGIGGVGSRQALAWATGEAQRTGAHLALLHGDGPLTVATEAPSPVAVVPLDQYEGESW